MTRFQELLRDFRQRHQLTQAEAAAEFGVSVRLVGFWESGDRYPSGTYLWQKATRSEDVEVVGICMLALRHAPE